jgi:metallo-beta-lactamase class B
MSLAISPAFAAPARISLEQLSGPLYLVVDSDFTSTNSLVYIGTKSIAVIGATWTPETAEALALRIRQVSTLPITEVIDTSPDPEWSGGNAYWTRVGAKIFAVSATYNLLRTTWIERDRRARISQPGYPVLSLVLPTDVFFDHFELQGGDVRAFFLGPTHTAGDIFVYFPREQVLDAGSILKEQLGNLADADLRAYPRTLQRLKQLHLKIRTIISGHWSPIHGPDLIDKYLSLLQGKQ